MSYACDCFSLPCAFSIFFFLFLTGWEFGLNSLQFSWDQGPTRLHYILDSFSEGLKLYIISWSLLHIFWLVKALSALIVQLLLAKLFLDLVDLHVIKYISFWILHIGFLTILFCFLNNIQCIDHIFSLPCFAYSIIFYPTHCFTFGIVVCMCAVYRTGR